jgi:ABC-type branched-subunit amino acid transport system ATPase component
MTAPLLRTTGLSRNFGGLQAVRNVDIELSQGQLHAVIGPNGAGKSTLVNLLSGELPPSRGRVELDGKDVTELAVHRRVQAGIARSFQRTNVLKELSALENVRLAAQAVHAPAGSLFRAATAASDLIDRAHAALQRAGIGAQARRAAGILSHGEQRQLEIAMTLATSPKVLLLDEPLAGMGQEEGERMVSLLKSLAQDHAVMLIEHDMDFVFKVADRMTVLVEGAVLASGAPADVRANRAVQTAYLGEHA